MTQGDFAVNLARRAGLGDGLHVAAAPVPARKKNGDP